MWRPMVVLTVLLALIGLVVVAIGAPWWIIPVGIGFMLTLIFGGSGGGNGGGNGGG
jgi:hypothetical protein